MRKLLLIVLLSFVTIAFGLQKPTNYFAGGPAFGGIRSNQQQISDFAVWNLTSGNWQHALSPQISGTLYGIVAVGDGLLAYGNFASFGGRRAASLAFYENGVWCAPEGLGLFNYLANGTYTSFDNYPTTVGTAFAATSPNNVDVYLYGGFNQVGLVRGGVAGLVKVSFSAGGIFTISLIGNGYYQTVLVNPVVPCVYCPADFQPGIGNKNKLITYSTATDQYFVFQSNQTGDLYQWHVGDPSWITITASNNARNLTGNIKDFDVNNNVIYAVGKFELFNVPNPANQYFHIATSSDFGVTWLAVANPQPLPVANFGTLPAIIDQYGETINPALTGTGLSAIAVQSASSIFVAGGYRVTARNSSQDPLANELQTRVIQITGSSYNLVTQRFAAINYLTAPDFAGPIISKLSLIGGNLYIFGLFYNYNQVVPAGLGSRFQSRYTNVYKGAAVYCPSNGQVTNAFGGFLSKLLSDATPDFNADKFYLSAGQNNLVYFASNPTTLQSSWGLLSGGFYSYGGDPLNNAQNRWNPSLGNNRFVSATGSSANPFTTLTPPFGPQPIGQDGAINALHLTKAGDAVIIGGTFDWIGTQRIGGIAFYNQDLNTVGSVGGGLFQYNNVPYFYSDNTYYNRVGGTVNDIEEYNGLLIAAGTFNRNNSGNCLSNIASISFRIGGAGWLALDGGCDNTINDILAVGSLLYATGTFTSCGLNPEGYQTGGLFRGRVPTSAIAVIDLSLDPTVQGWRPLALGLIGTTASPAVGNAMTYRAGELYVGGSFVSAGGVLNTAGIARWDGTRWKDVVAVCADPCNRPNNIFPYMGAALAPAPTSRKPLACVSLRTINGQVYCIDTATNVLAYWDGYSWRQTGTLTVTNGVQNSVIVFNGSNNNNLLLSSPPVFDANGFNFASWSIANQQYEPSFAGFSVAPNALAASSTIILSKIVLSFCFFIALVYFF